MVRSHRGTLSQAELLFVADRLGDGTMGGTSYPPKVLACGQEG